MPNKLFTIFLCFCSLATQACMPAKPAKLAATPPESLASVCRQQNWQPATCQGKVDGVNRAYLSTVTVYDSVNRVDGTKSTKLGTGSVISGRRIITAYHVVRRGGQIAVSFMSPVDTRKQGLKVRHPVDVIVIDELNDVAILRIRDKTLEIPPALPIRLEPLVAGEPVWKFGDTTIIGYGHFIGWRYIDEHKVTCAMATTKIWYGDSGGPILDEDFRIVGVIRLISNKTNMVLFTPLTAVEGIL